MIEVSESEARELLVQAIQRNGTNPGDHEEASLGQLVTAACHAVSGAVVAWCPVCKHEQQFCICNDEDAKQRERNWQMMSDEEKQELRKQVLRELKERLSDEDLEQIQREGESEMDHCIVCNQQRFTELLVQTTNGDKIGCAFCLEVTVKNEQTDREDDNQ